MGHPCRIRLNYLKNDVICPLFVTQLSAFLYKIVTQSLKFGPKPLHFKTDFKNFHFTVLKAFSKSARSITQGILILCFPRRIYLPCIPPDQDL